MYTPKEPDLRQALKRPETVARSRPRPGSLLDLVSSEDEDFPPAYHGSAAAETTRTTFSPNRQQAAIAEQINTPPAPVKGQIMDYVAALRAIGPDDVFHWLKDGLLWIIGATALCVAAALIYAMAAQPRYTVYTDLVIDPSNLQVVNDDVFGSNPQRDSQLLEVESKLRILTSRNVLTRVIDSMNLTQDPEFVKPGILAGIKALFSSASKDETQQAKLLGATRALSERVEARREERSFVVSLGVYTDNPEKVSRTVRCNRRRLRKGNLQNPPRKAPAGWQRRSMTVWKSCAATSPTRKRRWRNSSVRRGCNRRMASWSAHSLLPS